MTASRNIVKRARSAISQLRHYASQPSASTSADSSSSEWVRPIPEGASPAYDLALQFLETRARTLNTQADALKERLSSSNGSGEGETLLEKIRKLESEARLSDPRLRWVFENELGEGIGDENDAEALRILAERKWRKEGELDLLMQRVTQMFVIPDLIPMAKPTIDLQVKFGGEALTPGSYLLPSQTVHHPEITLQVFVEREQEHLYTLVMVDPDSPNSDEHTFDQYCHWIIPNIPISRTTTLIPSSLPSSLSYLPPHPSPQTPYHRYTLLLLRQPTSNSPFNPSIPESRSSFNLRTWAAENGFDDLSQVVGGISMFREGGKGWGKDLKDKEQVWKKEKEVVQGIYRDTLGGEMPEYAKVPKFLRYGYPGEKIRR